MAVLPEKSWYFTAQCRQFGIQSTVFAQNPLEAMSLSRAHSIEVSVTTEYLPDQSNPDARRYAFAYHITIRNTGSTAAKLLSRHWIITDGGGQVEEVRGEGVVGSQPVVSAGGCYEYSSGAVLETPVGSMRGSYQFVGSDGQTFSALIPVFTLAMPMALN